MKLSKIPRANAGNIFRRKSADETYGHVGIIRRTGFKVRCCCRYTTCIFGFLITLVLNAHRINIGVAILKMANTTQQLRNGTLQCWSDYAITVPEAAGEFDWSPDIQGYILAAGHVGYLVSQIPGGRLAENYGSKVVLTSCLFLSSLTNILSPWSARLHVGCFILMQTLKGLALGTLTPALSCLMASWFPRTERRFLSSVVYSGFPVGALVGGLVSGELSEIEFLNGWPLVFHVFGAAGCLLCALMLAFMYENPETHPWIEESEIKYIRDQRETTLCSQRKIPWKELLFSGSSLALFCGYFGQFWAGYYFLSEHPQYMGNVLDFSISESGTLSSVPFIFQAIMTCAGSYLANFMHRKNWLSLDWVHKGNNTLSCVSLTVFQIGMYYAGCDKLVNIICLFGAVAVTGFGYPGSVTAPVDMTPNFAGTLTGVASTVSGFSGFFLPIVVGHFIREEQSVRQWQKVFLVNIAVIFSSGIIFAVFGSTVVQEWNDSHGASSEAKRENSDQVVKDAGSFDTGDFPYVTHL